MRFASKFILVGDHFQLPPLVRFPPLSCDLIVSDLRSQQVQNRAARKGGLQVSLFRCLSDAHPEAVVDLTYQYRMCSDIMLLSNRLIYSDRLKCGSEEVAAQSLKLPNLAFLETLHSRSPCCGYSCWINKLMDER